MQLLSSKKCHLVLAFLLSLFIPVFTAIVPWVHAYSGTSERAHASAAASWEQRYQSATTHVLGELDTIDSTIAVTGSLAFVGSSYPEPQSSLGMLDISDPARLARRTLLPFQVQKIQLAGSHAYVATRAMGLQILDISNPISPTVLGSFGGAAWVRDMQVVDNTAYLLTSAYSQQDNANRSTLQIVDVSWPTAPTLLGSLQLLADSARLRVSNSRVYVDQLYIPLTGSGPGFGIIDSSDPMHPAALAAYSTSYASFEAMGMLVYAAQGNTFDIIDTSMPATPVLQSSTPVSATNAMISLQGNKAYLAGGSPASSAGNLTIVDVTDVADPVLLSSTDVPYQNCQPYVVDTRLYALCADGLHIYDVSNAGAPNHLGVYTVPKHVRRVQVVGTRAYLIEQPAQNIVFPGTDSCPRGGNKLWITDVADPAAPVPISTLTIGTCANLLDIVADRLYLAEANTIKIVNASDAAHPFIEMTITLPASGQVVQLAGSRAYVVDGSRFSLVDISNPASPALQGSYNFATGNISAFQAVGNTVYLINNGLHILDVGEPTRPILLNVDHPLPIYGALKIIDMRAYVVRTTGGALPGSYISLSIIDIRNPQSPVLRGEYTTDRVWSFADSSAPQVEIADDLLFLISGSPNSASWDILDVTDDAQPRRVGSYTSVGKPHDAQVVNGYLYLATEGGFQILRVIAPMCNCSDVYLPVVER